MDILYVVMPAYNEEENIEKTIRDWYPVLDFAAEESRLVIADAGSTDNTHNLLLGLMHEFPKLIVYTESGKQHGPKLMALYDYAIKQGADYVFQTDSDGQTNPQEFIDFWNDREKFDAIIGNRTVRGDGIARAFVEKVVCVLLNMYFGVKVPDANAPFRLMKTELISKYIGRLPKDYNIPNIMFTTYFKFYDENIDFRVISFKARAGGVNSINIPAIVKVGIKALKDFADLKKGMK